MADRFSAKIEIGGTITKHQAQGLITVIRHSGASHEWGDAPFKPETIKDIVELVREDGILELVDHEARYGEFPDLEDYLVASQIPFDRHSDAQYEYDGELVSYRPETGRITHTATEDGNRMVDYVTVRNALTLLESGKIEKAGKLLNDLLGPVIPEIPPLQIK